MAKRKRRGFGKKHRSIPLSIAVPVVAVGYSEIVKPLMAGQTNTVILNMTGVNMTERKFHANELIQTYGPIAAGAVIHMIASSPRLKSVQNAVKSATLGFFSI